MQRVWLVAALHWSASGLQLKTLLSTCVDACGRGCAEVRCVHERGGGALEARTAAASAMAGALRREWGPELAIVTDTEGSEAADGAEAGSGRRTRHYCTARTTEFRRSAGCSCVRDEGRLVVVKRKDRAP